MTSRSNALLWPGTVPAEVTRSQRLTVYSLCCDCTVVPRRCLSSSLGVTNGGPFFFTDRHGVIISPSRPLGSIVQFSLYQLG